MKDTVSGMLRPVALVRTDVSEERISSMIRVTRIGDLGATLAVSSNRNTLHVRKQLGVSLLPPYVFIGWCFINYAQ
jgi:hypothetical protein